MKYYGKIISNKYQGNGKEYYIKGGLKYEGEYKNGCLWTGKGYDGKGQKEYEIKNGKGFVIEYDKKGKLLYEGEYLNGEKNGNGKEFASNTLIFEGKYLNGERNEKEYNNDGELISEEEFLKNYYFINKK